MILDNGSCITRKNSHLIDRCDDGGEPKRTVPGHKRHPHGHQTPSKQRDLLQLGLGEVPAVPEHLGPHGQVLDHVEVAPADMVGDDDGRLADRELVSRDDDPRAVEPLEYELYASPAGPGDGAGEPVGQERVEGPQQQEEREQ